MTPRQILKKWIYRYTPGLAGAFPYFGTQLYFPRNNSLWDRVCEQGIYEYVLLHQIQSALRPDTWFFDVGANIGLMSVPILSQVPTAHVLSFEPSPNTQPFLEKTWSRSPWKDRWKIVAQAVGDKVGETSFCVSVPREAACDGIRYTNRAEKAGTIMVPMTTLDEEWKALGRPAVSCLKLDIEGAEMLALAGARELIQAVQPLIFLEWNRTNFEPFGCRPQDLLEFAGKFGYETLPVPGLSVITSVRILMLHMCETETFALVPKST